MPKSQFGTKIVACESCPLPTLRAFYGRPEHADAKGAFLTWPGHTLKAKRQTPADVKADFGTASTLKSSRVVFNISGNKYRLVPSINYPYGIVFVRFVGRHKQYDAIDAQTIEGDYEH